MEHFYFCTECMIGRSREEIGMGGELWGGEGGHHLGYKGSFLVVGK